MNRRLANKRRTRDRTEARKYDRRHAGWHLRWWHIATHWGHWEYSPSLAMWIGRMSNPGPGEPIHD